MQDSKRKTRVSFILRKIQTPEGFNDRLDWRKCHSFVKSTQKT